MKQDTRTYIGNGLNFPLRTDARGQLALVTGSEDIEQSIRIILGTRPGERVMRPTFGCRAHELIFEPISAATATLMQEYVYDALRMWEPRIEVADVNIEIEAGAAGMLLAVVEYIIKSTHDTRSIVYPFYIAEEPEI